MKRWLRYLGWVVLFVVISVVFGLLPASCTDPIVPAATLLLLIVTGELALATWRYARSAEASRDVMDKQAAIMNEQADLIRLQLNAADKQRLATIRPVITFQNDLDDPKAMARYEKENTAWEELLRAHQAPNPSRWLRPLGDRPKQPGACLVNGGNGVALRIEARARTDEQKTLTRRAASLMVHGSHWLKSWYDDLRGHRVLSFTVTYRDAEGTLYYTAARNMTSDDDPWRVGEGPLPNEFAIDEGLVQGVSEATDEHPA